MNYDFEDTPTSYWALAISCVALVVSFVTLLVLLIALFF